MAVARCLRVLRLPPFASLALLVIVLGSALVVDLLLAGTRVEITDGGATSSTETASAKAKKTYTKTFAAIGERRFGCFIVRLCICSAAGAFLLATAGFVAFFVYRRRQHLRLAREKVNR